MNSDLVQKALQFGAEKHRNQVRKGSELPYIIHPVSVAFYVMKYVPDFKNCETLVCAAILHDTVEDTSTTLEEIANEFNQPVSDLVKELTSHKQICRLIGKNNYLKPKMEKMSNDALILKLCDRLSNVSDQPTPKYKTDTIELLNSLNRRLSPIQERIAKDILDVCMNVAE